MMNSKRIASYNHSGRIGVMVEFACESFMPFDDAEFSTFIHDVAMHIAAEDPSDINELLIQLFIKNPEVTIRQSIDEAILKHEENIKVCRFIRWDTEKLTSPPEDLPPKSPAAAMKVVK
ncbi:hypothetical protein [Candidatus Thiodiazotropha sp. CDECU1]|uniref:hypothetical protein n=1 Tax=Candidatus Thiodiazotropha sp. CDECU1 TaxID=3065865 RepID=UPI00292E1204|nr:hypothetical protein [Candidatus Thiodiazotropha sp. CDECU1]